MDNTYSGAPLVSETAVLAQLLVKLAFSRKLKHQEYTFVVVEVSVKS